MYFESVDKDADEEEHSIELQLPFLAKILNTYIYIKKKLILLIEQNSKLFLF